MTILVMVKKRRHGGRTRRRSAGKGKASVIRGWWLELSEAPKSKSKALRVYTVTEKVAEVKAKLKKGL